VSDNGAGLRAFFYGLCAFYDIAALEPERHGEEAADFYLPGPQFGLYVLILPEPADRQVEIAVLRDHQARFILLDREDLDVMRAAGTRSAAVEWITQRAQFGTHCDAMRRRAGIF
jgi:hypothetical protein